MITIIEKVIKNPKYIKLMNSEAPEKLSFYITNQSEQIFAIHIDNNTAKFHPLNPKSIKK